MSLLRKVRLKVAEEAHVDLEEYTTAPVGAQGIGQQIIAGRYGFGSKDTTSGQIVAVYDNLKAASSKDHFTIGIEDDVNNSSLKTIVDRARDIGNEKINSAPLGRKFCYG